MYKIKLKDIFEPNMEDGSCLVVVRYNTGFVPYLFDYYNNTKVGWIPASELKLGVSKPPEGGHFYIKYDQDNGCHFCEPESTLMHSRNFQPSVPTTNPKEPTMIDNVINTNKQAAAQAVTLEAGRLANVTLARIVSKKFPMLPQTPFNTLILANLVSIIATQIKPSPKLQKVANAMVTEAYQEVYQLIDLEGLIAELMDGVNLLEAE